MSNPYDPVENALRKEVTSLRLYIHELKVQRDGFKAALEKAVLEVIREAAKEGRDAK